MNTTTKATTAADHEAQAGQVVCVDHGAILIIRDGGGYPVQALKNEHGRLQDFIPVQKAS